MSRKMINIQEDLYNEVRERYPHLSWTEILRLTLDMSPKYVTVDELKELKDKFNTVISKLAKDNNLTL